MTAKADQHKIRIILDKDVRAALFRRQHASGASARAVINSALRSVLADDIAALRTNAVTNDLENACIPAK